MKIKLLKDHTLGKAGDEVDIAEGMAKYLMRMGVAIGLTDVGVFTSSEKITQEEWDDLRAAVQGRFEKDEVMPAKEKKEFKPEQEKQSHSGLPTAKKRGRKPKEK